LTAREDWLLRGGAEAFCTIRSHLATAARHGIGWLDALTRAAEGNPWIPRST
jgi:transposase